jgi:hypothetical protein
MNMNDQNIPYPVKNRGSPCRLGTSGFRDPGNPHQRHVFLGIDINRASANLAIIGCMDSINVFTKTFTSELKSMGLAHASNYVGIIGNYLISHVRVVFPSFNDNEIEKLLTVAFTSWGNLSNAGWMDFLRLGTTRFRQSLRQERQREAMLMIDALHVAVSFMRSMGMEVALGIEDLHAMEKIGAMYDFEIDFINFLNNIESMFHLNPLSVERVETRLNTGTTWSGSLMRGNNVHLILLNPMHTSKLCSSCMRRGQINEVRRFGRRNILCSHCGSIIDRDENAAVVIAVIAMLMLGGYLPQTSMRQCFKHPH